MSREHRDIGGDTPRTDALAESNATADILIAHNDMLDHARALEREAVTAHARGDRWSLLAQEIEAPARELLYLYDWRPELARLEKDPTADPREVKRLLREYGERKKAGWIALRAALGEKHEQATETHRKLAEPDAQVEREGLAPIPETLVSEAPSAAQALTDRQYAMDVRGKAERFARAVVDEGFNHCQDGSAWCDACGADREDGKTPHEQGCVVGEAEAFLAEAALAKNQRQGADSPTSATIDAPETTQLYVGVTTPAHLVHAPGSTPSAQSAPATLASELTGHMLHCNAHPASPLGEGICICKPGEPQTKSSSFKSTER